MSYTLYGKGKQILNWNYNFPVEAPYVNKLFHNFFETLGTLNSELEIVVTNDGINNIYNTKILSGFSAILNPYQDTNTVLKVTTTIDDEVAFPFNWVSGRMIVDETKNNLILRYIYKEIENNYAEFLYVSTSEIVSTDILLCRFTYTHDLLNPYYPNDFPTITLSTSSQNIAKLRQTLFYSLENCNNQFNLQSNLLKGRLLGHEEGNIPYNESGQLNIGLYADKFNDYDIGHENGNIAVADGVVNDELVSEFISDGVSNYKSGNSNGCIPINNGTLCVNLNAEFLNGKEVAEIFEGTHTHSLDDIDDSLNYNKVIGVDSSNLATEISIEDGSFLYEHQNIKDFETCFRIDNTSIKKLFLNYDTGINNYKIKDFAAFTGDSITVVNPDFNEDPRIFVGASNETGWGENTGCVILYNINNTASNYNFKVYGRRTTLYNDGGDLYLSTDSTDLVDVAYFAIGQREETGGPL